MTHDELVAHLILVGFKYKHYAVDGSKESFVLQKPNKKNFLSVVPTKDPVQGDVRYYSYYVGSTRKYSSKYPDTIWTHVKKGL